MTIQEKVEALIQEASELPEEAQVELVQSLVDMRSQNLGVYHLDDQERAALARSREEVRQGRFVTDEQMNEIFSRYGA